MAEISFRSVWHLLRDTGSGFMKDKVLKLSASLAYYTIFSLGPMLLVIIFLSGMIWGQEAIEGRIFEQIREIVGEKAALQIQQIITNITISGNSIVGAVIGFVTLIIGATTVFAEIQDSINTIWRLKVKPERGWLIMLKKRLLSFSLVISLGFLLIVSLVINGLIETLMDHLKIIFPRVTVVLLYITNLLITLLVTSALFGIIYKVLPDAKIRWKDVAVGAVFTAILFMIGKFGITLYIGNSNVGSAYGTAGSLVILLLWVYFSAAILYFGAEFTKCYAIKFGKEIRPESYAVIVHTVQVESKNSSLQEEQEVVEETQRELQKAKDNVDKNKQEKRVHNPESKNPE